MGQLALACLPFAACAALATVAQNLTGFAFALVLLGLVGLFDLVPLADAADASSMLTLVHAAIHFGGSGLTPHWRVMRPVLWTTPLGVAAGVFLLAWLSSGALSTLRAVLGLVIVVSAIVLVTNARRRDIVSGPTPFAIAGAVSGLMGGLFASPGPPLVYHMYRQPLEPSVVRQCLLLVFAANAALRLLMVGFAGRLSLDAVVLALAAAPAVAGANLWLRRSVRVDHGATLRVLVAALLVAAGAILVVDGIGA
ncbi:MAG: TSUP family transporter [Burkholderiaceae bacterium]|nr:TSUP family transporter [Burkholderiaceae bacterium]